jgi:hypothetical protein
MFTLLSKLHGVRMTPSAVSLGTNSLQKASILTPF